MNGSRCARLLIAVVVLMTAVPLFAARGADITLPVAGGLILPHVTYYTELMIINHSDVQGAVRFDMISDGYATPEFALTIPPKTTVYRQLRGFDNGKPVPGVGALRVVSVLTLNGDDASNLPFNPAGDIEVRGYIIAERGRFGSKGASRQEIEAIPAAEYTAPEAVFAGIRHDLPTYTNVGITNMSATQEQRFFVELQFLGQLAEVVVPPLSQRQIRLPKEGNSGRYLVVTPEWARTGAAPLPWVAYTSTVDGVIGDAYSGLRVPAGTNLTPRD